MNDIFACYSPVLQWMIETGVPLTREVYLDMAYPLGMPEEWGAELEIEVPEPFRNPSAYTHREDLHD